MFCLASFYFLGFLFNVFLIQLRNSAQLGKVYILNSFFFFFFLKLSTTCSSKDRINNKYQENEELERLSNIFGRTNKNRS